MDKIKELKPGEMVIGVAGIVLFLDSFLNWYSIDFGFVSASRNGWQEPKAFLSIMAILIGVALVALLVIKTFTDVELPDQCGPLTWEQVYTIAGAVAFVFVLIKWIGDTEYTAIGLYIGLLSTAALAVGGFMAMQGIGETGDAGGGGGTPPPPPPSA